MKFKRIGTDTVRCLISENELNANGLQINDFLNNKDKTQDFLRKIIVMAQQEVDYKVQGGAISVQIAVIEDHTLALTLSENQEKGILEVLGNLKSEVAILTGISDQELKSAVSDTNHDTNEKEVSEKNKKNDISDEARLIKRLDRDVYELEFTSMDNFTRFCKGIVLVTEPHNKLYKLTSNGFYYLFLWKEDMTDNQLCRILGASLEFTEGIYSDGRMKAFLEEHGKCLIEKRAIQIIKNL